ncbi:MAG TPA: DUF4388 domain-containing protein [Acidimicrobiia bacterium]|nr:DUF4388 domain-containing protein [Acidimicrobiia bacterium]
MQLSGQLSDWSVNDLLQIMQVTRKTGSLDIVSEKQARIFFSEGLVTGAELTGTKGTYFGRDRSGIADIVYVVSGVDTGQFSVGPADGPDVKGWTVEEILTDVEALTSLEGEVVDAGLFEAAGVRLVREIDGPITIEPEDWHALVNLVQTFTFDHLEARFGRGSAVRTFHTLHRFGMAEALVAEEGESNWLDRLAEDVAPGAGIPNWLESAPAVETKEAELVGAALEPEPVQASSAEEASPQPDRVSVEVKGVSAPASTTLTDGVYDEIRRLRSRVADK